MNLKDSNSYHKNTYTSTFIDVLFTKAQKWKHPSHPSINQWITKTSYIYTMEFYTASKKHKIIKFEEKIINLEIILSELPQF